MKFCIETLGCKVNQVESRAMAGAMIKRGHIETAAGSGCEVCIINTCAVTGESARKSRQAIRRLKRLEPDAVIAVCGCLSQLEPDEIAALGAGLVGGSGGRLSFIDELEALLLHDRRVKIVTDDVYSRRFFEELPQDSGVLRTRAMLKIQDGCDNYCAYCVIPYSRGHVRSLPPDNASEAARRFKEEGFLEIVITGIEISSYGRDLGGGITLADAAAQIAKAASGVRLRLGSLDPGAVTEEFCNKLCGIPNLCAHFHLSVQSGSNDTLRRMGRRYDTDTMYSAVRELREKFSQDCGITADLITGFPGETDKEFEETLRFIKEAAFSDMHIFPFSARPGTRAYDMPGQIEKKVRRERAGRAAALASELSFEFKRRQIGKCVNVLFERERDGCWTGYSENYIEVSVLSGGVRNSIQPVKLTDVDKDAVFGEISGV